MVTHSLRGFAYLPSFFSQILNLIYWTVFIFMSIFFEWHATEKKVTVRGASTSDLILKEFMQSHGFKLFWSRTELPVNWRELEQKIVVYMG